MKGSSISCSLYHSVHAWLVSDPSLDVLPNSTPPQGLHRTAPLARGKSDRLVNTPREDEVSCSPRESKPQEQKFMSLNSTDKGLLTPDNCAVLFIDHQPQMFFGVANIDRQDLLNNVLVLAKAAKIFHVPVILTAVEFQEFSGHTNPQPPPLFPHPKPTFSS